MTDIGAWAIQEGFLPPRVMPPVTLKRTEVFARNEQVADDPKALLPDARAIVLLLYPYRPYRMPDHWREAEISAYYPASNQAHHACERFARRLRDEGWQAVANAKLPLKRLVYAAYACELGRNGLASTENAGTRFAICAVVTDAPLWDGDALIPRAYALSPSCAHCSLCVRACPTGALDGTGHVDIQKCLRAQPEAGPIREDYRALYGSSVLGCDLCQDVCPRNRDVKRVDPEPALANALSLKKLLTGDVAPLGDLIGTNYARKGRLAASALLAAGNRRRRDLTDEISALTDSPLPGVRKHAEWALNRIEEKREEQ